MDVRDGDRIGGDVVGNRKTGNAGSVDGQRIELVQSSTRHSARRAGRCRREIMIEPEAALIIVVDPSLGGFKNVGADVGQRIELRRLRAMGLSRDGGILLPGKRLAGEFVDQGNGCPLSPDEPKIAGALGRGGYDGRLRRALGIALALVIDKEEILVFADGSAQRRAVLIAVQRFGCGGEEVARVEGVVAQEIVNVAMKGVAAGLGDHRGGRAAGFAILGGRVQRENAELADGVHRDAQRVSAIHAVHIGRAIEQVVVRFRRAAR